MKYEIFISHSSKDKAVAQAICAHLETGGRRCWIAPRDILPGADWGESIIDAISQVRVMVLVITQHANVSEQIKREVERCVNRKVAIVPVRLEDVVLSKSLELHQHFALVRRLPSH